MRILIILMFGALLKANYTPLVENSSKAQKVYEKLKKALGDRRVDWPELTILDRKLNAASYRAIDNKLILEETSLNLCIQLGDEAEQAIAFLLGHELTHFYQHKDWGEGTCWGHGVSAEEEADVHGAFLAYLAGYDVKKAAPKILEAIYATYEFNTKLKNYPSLVERQQITQKALEKVKVLETIYEHAGILMVLGFHKEAVFCYEYLLKQVKTQELYNNAGTTFLAAAIAQIRTEKGELYQYPIELQSDFSLNAQQIRGMEGVINQYRLLGMAKQNFEKAIQFNSNNFSARLNLACAISLSEKEVNQDVWDYISAAEKEVNTPLELSKLSVLKGIIYAGFDKIELANKEFGNANQKNAHEGIKKMVEYNSNLLFKKENKTTPPSFSKSKDIIENIRLRNYESIDYDYNITFPQLGEYISAIAIKNYTQSCLVKIPLHKRTIVLHSTKNSTNKTNKGVAVGDSFEYLTKQYIDEYSTTINTSDGFFIVYPQLRLFFKVNKTNKIALWGIFMKRIKS